MAGPREKSLDVRQLSGPGTGLKFKLRVKRGAAEENSRTWAKRKKGKGRSSGWHVNEEGMTKAENEGVTRLDEGRAERWTAASFVDVSRSRPGIFIIPFKNLHRKIRLSYWLLCYRFHLRTGRDGEFSNELYSPALISYSIFD